ncbi:GNAT family N-acetyltransferase [Citricoccus sp. SGAir0253]|uniref:GNAT family N-acetyltransferase n=1 Tax=Citricoccus sp. SGAir0253 TaxID=2567881 RepID=UPI0010CD3554|nr:GNAT family N-acetyltransferase [Citricoccus sp. SGAir0253]QCU78154.1 GNAT family N-acetyltransferase [Citricoccus sp. SGAir0253]
MRFSSGITRRANSVLSTVVPGDPAAVAAAVDEVERRSAERWLAPTFQVWEPAPGSAGTADAAGRAGAEDAGFLEGQRRLAALLEARGYTTVAPTRVLWMGREGIPRDTQWDPRVIVSETLSDTWLDAHMGPSAGGVDPASRLVYRRLLTGGSSRFYSYQDGQGVPAAIAKVSLVQDGDATFGGVYGLKVRPDRRGAGLVRRIIEAMFHHAVRMGLDGVWIQVEERSERALALSAELGFATAARYRYLTRPT